MSILDRPMKVIDSPVIMPMNLYIGWNRHEAMADFVLKYQRSIEPNLNAVPPFEVVQIAGDYKYPNRVLITQDSKVTIEHLSGAQ